MRGFALLALVLSLSSPTWAQQPEPAPPAPLTPAAPPTPAAQDTIDATKLGVSLSRIQKGLRVTESREKAKQVGALRLEFQVQVYGQAPKIEFFKGIDLFTGPVPGTAPTHRQFIEFVTPSIYRQPSMPISTLAFWAATQLWQQSKKSKCEGEIAAYRALLMQGVNVSAPRCTQ